MQRQWSTSLVLQDPFLAASNSAPVGEVLASLRHGLVEVSDVVLDDHVAAVVDYATASDREVVTLGARETLRDLAVEVPTDRCWNQAPCDEVVVSGARLTSVVAPTARGEASVPAWAYTVEGRTETLVLPAVRVTLPTDLNPNHSGDAHSTVLTRHGTTLRVRLFQPHCGYGANPRHLLETPGAIVVWASGTPNSDECAAPALEEATFTLRAPVGDRPVVDEEGRLLMPEWTAPVALP